MPTLPVAFRVLAGVAMLVVAACDATGSSAELTPEPTSAGSLAGTWTLVSVGATPVVVGSAAHLGFDAAGTVSGSTGCNQVSGTYAVDGAALTFGPMAATRMACEEALMAQETAVLRALEGVDGWAIDADGRLHLRGATELVLDPTPA